VIIKEFFSVNKRANGGITCRCGANSIVRLFQLKCSKSRRFPALPSSGQIDVGLGSALRFFFWNTRIPLDIVCKIKKYMTPITGVANILVQ
jgi:hypothetical protein